MPKISVIMPVYNAELYLNDCLESIINQTFKDIEIICVDDKSTDKSLSILEEYANKDSRIVFLKNDVNLGIVETINKGLDLAKGEFIARMDNDDIAELNRLQVQLDFLEANPNIGLCGSFIKKFGSVKRFVKLPISPQEIKAALCFSCCIMHPTVMVRAELLKKYNLRYDKEFNNSEDFDLWTRCVRFFDIANIPKPLLKYRVHEKSISSSKRQEQTAKTLKIIKKQFKNYFNTEFDEKDLNLLFDTANLNQESYINLENLYRQLISLNKETNSVRQDLFEFYLKKAIAKNLRRKFKKTKQIFYLQKIFEFNKTKAILLAAANFYRLKF